MSTRVDPATGIVENPYAAYGLNPDGSPIGSAVPKPEGDGKPPEEKKVDPRDVEIAALKTSLGEANEKLKQLDGLGDKFKVIDKLVKAFAGDEDPNAKTYAKVWGDLKLIAPPGVRKALELLEQDPEALDKLGNEVVGLQRMKIGEMNTQAHGHIVDLAKKVFPTKGLTPAEVNELVFPFERAITDIINSNKTIRERFISGDMTVVEELFNRLAKAHVAGRLRDKQARLEKQGGPKAPPRSSGPGAKDDTDKPQKPDIHTPKGRAAFHKAAVGRFFDKRSQAEEE